MKNNIDLSISIVSYNTKYLLRSCLASICKHTRGIKFEIFVVDNASTDGSPLMVAREFPCVHLIRNSKNLFFTKAHNQALKISKGRYVLILNSDTQIQGDSFTKALKFLKEHPEIGALGIQQMSRNSIVDRTCQQFTNPFHEFLRSNYLTLKFPAPQIIKKIFYSSWDRKSSRFVDIVSDACLIAPRNVLKKIGWYDERFLLFFTENDLCLRIHKACYKVYYFADSKIIHICNQSLKKLKSEKANKIYEHDLLIYYKKHFGFFGWLFLYLTIKPNRLYYFFQPLITRFKKN